VNGSVVFDVYDFFDPSNSLSAIPVMWTSWGIIAGHKINDSFHIETGLSKKEYFFGFGLFDEGKAYHEMKYSSFNSWQVPVKLISRLNLFENRIYLTCRLGLKLGINTSYNSMGSSAETGSCTYENLSVKFSHEKYDKLLFPLLESGIGFDFRLYENSFLFFSTNYHSGFSTVDVVNIEYTDKNNVQGTAHGISKGNFWEALAGFKFFFD